MGQNYIPTIQITPWLGLQLQDFSITFASKF